MNAFEKDKTKTVENRRRLFRNKNLLYWYQSLYARQFFGTEHPEKLFILEIGSGASPLKKFYPTVISSDIMDLDYLDLCFDCHRIDTVREIPNGSIDIITLTNVLHHLERPLQFIRNAAVKLKPGGRLIVTEPYLSLLSRFIYKYLHHEPCDFGLEEPALEKIEGPLSSANSALPHAIFFSAACWHEELFDLYCFNPGEAKFFTSLSYFLTGGISHRFPIPHRLYRSFFHFDRLLAEKAPRTFSSFFTLELIRR